MHDDGAAVEGVLSKDMASVCEYLQTWKLKLGTTKTVAAAFHLRNKAAERELKVNFNKETLPFCSKPKYLGVTLDRPLTYRRHLHSLHKRLTSCVTLLRRLAVSRLGCWSNNTANHHPSPGTFNNRILRSCLVPQCSYPLIDPAINDALRILTGCLSPTPVDNLLVFAGIQPAEHRPSGATLSPARCAMKPGRLLHSALTHPSSANARRPNRELVYTRRTTTHQFI